MQIASDEQHQSQVDVVKSKRQLADEIARLQHEVRTAEADAKAKKAEAERVTNEAKTQMDTV